MSEVKYNQSEVNAELADIFKMVLPDLRKKYEKPFDDYTLEKVWSGSVVVGQIFYVFHVKQGHIPNHHHYTVQFEVNHGKYKFGWCEEGLKTVFWSSIYYTSKLLFHKLKYLSVIFIK